MKKVSIIVPAYKSESTISETINSIKKQTYKNVEVLVIENGTKDSTESIIDGYKKELEIKYFYSEKPNVSNARNIGLQNATGDYIAFIDSDDRYENDYLSKMVNCIEGNNSQLVTCGYSTSDNKIKRLVGENDEIRNTTNLQKYLEELKKNLLFNEIWNKLYLSNIIKENQIRFDDSFELGEDYLFNLKYFNCIKTACYINEPLYIYTISEDGLKLKYRKDRFNIEYKLTQYLKDYYLKHDYSMEFVNNQFARIYYNGIIDIFKDNNPANQKERIEQLNVFVSQKQYNQDMLYLKDKVTDKKFKFAINHFFTKGINRIRLFVYLNKIFHR